MRRPGEGESFDFQGAVFTVKASGHDTEGRVGVMEQRAPHGLRVPGHVHDGEDEMFHVLDGHVRGFCGGEPFDAPSGSFIFLPRDVEHGLEVVGDGPARLLTIVGPAVFDRIVVENGDPIGRDVPHP